MPFSGIPAIYLEKLTRYHKMPARGGSKLVY